MAQLRCTSCDQRFSREDAVRSDFKCPSCGGLALFDWTQEGAGESDSSRARRLRQSVGRWFKGGTR